MIDNKAPKSVITIPINKVSFKGSKPYIENNGRRYYYSGNHTFSPSSVQFIRDYFHRQGPKKRKNHVIKYIYPIVTVTLSHADRVFYFDENFDLQRYICMVINYMTGDIDVTPYYYQQQRKVLLKSCDIEFYDGFYKIIIQQGDKHRTTIAPKIFKNPYSTSNLNLIKNEIVSKAGKGIFVFYNSTEVQGLNKELDLERCIEFIKRSNNSVFEDIEYTITSGVRSLKDCISATKTTSYYNSKYNCISLE